MARTTRDNNRTFRSLARQAIRAYTSPNDLVIDPMCGTGDTLVEAIKSDRMAIGIEYQRYWAEIARRRVETASGSPSGRGYGVVVHGDPLEAGRLVGADVKGRAALVIASLQNGTVRSVHDCDFICGDLTDVAAGFTVVLAQCRELLRPDGHLAVITMPVKHEGTWTDLNSVTHEPALNAGFVAASITLETDAPFSVYRIRESLTASGKSGAIEVPSA